MSFFQVVDESVREMFHNFLVMLENIEQTIEEFLAGNGVTDRGDSQ